MTIKLSTETEKKVNKNQKKLDKKNFTVSFDIFKSALDSLLKDSEQKRYFDSFMEAVYAS